jgi:predicted metal-dependent hydrolase
MPLPLLQHELSGLPFAFALRRSARRSLSIEVVNAQVRVRAPLFLAEADIERFVRAKSLWVQRTLVQQTQRLSALPLYSFADGSHITFLGEPLRLVVQQGLKADIVRKGAELWVHLGGRSKLSAALQTRNLVAEWFQRQAMVLLMSKTRDACSYLGVAHSGLSLKATRSKWGHCTPQGAIQYNWQIMLAPEAIVDYLVAHEVCHLVHLNHSPAFWALVQSLCPDYQQRRAWLKANGMQLMF